MSVQVDRGEERPPRAGLRRRAADAVDYSYFTDEMLKDYADKAVDQALIISESRPAARGQHDRVPGPLAGVLLTRPIGPAWRAIHRQGSSAVLGKARERVAAKASPSSMTAPCPVARVRSTSTTRAIPRRATCS